MRDKGEVPTTRDLRRILAIARRKALALGANTHEADEVAQETALRLYMKWRSRSVRRARARNEVRWDAFVRRVAQNIHWDLIKSHQRRLRRQTKAAGKDVPILHQSGAISAPASPDGVDTYMARAMLAEEILKLPRQQRAVAIRICIEEKTVNEVAVELQLQPQSVRKHMRLARETLRQMLEETGSRRR